MNFIFHVELERLQLFLCNISGMALDVCCILNLYPCNNQILWYLVSRKMDSENRPGTQEYGIIDRGHSTVLLEERMRPL